MNLQNISLGLNVILALVSIYLFLEKRKVSQFEAERNYQDSRLKVHDLSSRNHDEYKKRAVELGAYLDGDDRISERSLRAVGFSGVKELETLATRQEVELNRARNDLRYWSRVGNIDMFSDTPMSVKDRVVGAIDSYQHRIRRRFSK